MPRNLPQGPKGSGGNCSNILLLTSKSHSSMSLGNFLYINVTTRGLVNLHVMYKRPTLGGHSHSDGRGRRHDRLRKSRILHGDWCLRQTDVLLFGLGQLLMNDGAGLSSMRRGGGDGGTLPVYNVTVGEDAGEDPEEEATRLGPVTVTPSCPGPTLWGRGAVGSSVPVSPATINPIVVPSTLVVVAVPLLSSTFLLIANFAPRLHIQALESTTRVLVVMVPIGSNMFVSA